MKVTPDFTENGFTAFMRTHTNKKEIEEKKNYNASQLLHNQYSFQSTQKNKKRGDEKEREKKESSHQNLTSI